MLSEVVRPWTSSRAEAIRSLALKLRAWGLRDATGWCKVLLQHEKIRECAVVGKPDETWGEKAWHVKLLAELWSGDCCVRLREGCRADDQGARKAHTLLAFYWHFHACSGAKRVGERAVGFLQGHGPKELHVYHVSFVSS